MDVLMISKMDYYKDLLLIKELDSSLLAQGTGMCHCKYGNALSDPIE